MSMRKAIISMIYWLEYYTLKDIECTIDGPCETCALVLYDRLDECVKARKKINYKPYENVEVLLEACAYDKYFINKFMARARCCGAYLINDDRKVTQKECLRHLICLVEYRLLKGIEQDMYSCGYSDEKYYVAYHNQLMECFAAEKEAGLITFQSVEEFLKDTGYDRDFIDKFLRELDVYRKIDEAIRNERKAQAQKPKETSLV